MKTELSMKVQELREQLRMATRTAAGVLQSGDPAAWVLEQEKIAALVSQIDDILNTPEVANETPAHLLTYEVMQANRFVSIELGGNTISG